MLLAVRLVSGCSDTHMGEYGAVAGKRGAVALRSAVQANNWVRGAPWAAADEARANSTADAKAMTARIFEHVCKVMGGGGS